MTSIETDAREYLKWMAIHNYARTTITCRCRYLGYFVEFAGAQGVDRSEDVTLELLVSYQQSLFAHRKRDGDPLSFGTQAQRLVPVAQLFSWLRRQHRIEVNPAADLLMPRPDRRLPEATLERRGDGGPARARPTSPSPSDYETVPYWRSSTPVGFAGPSSSLFG